MGAPPCLVDWGMNSCANAEEVRVGAICFCRIFYLSVSLKHTFVRKLAFYVKSSRKILLTFA